MASIKLEVKYLGFVHTDIPGGGKPSMVQVKAAHKMMLKKNVKKTREMHPLFARGFDETLNLEASEKGLMISNAGTTLMNQAMHKIAFVASIGKVLHIVIKRPGDGLFKCHGVEAKSESVAVQLTKQLSQITNEVFAKLRHVNRILEAQRARAKAAPPAVPARKIIADEDQPWYHGKMSRKEAEALLLAQQRTNGLFLVRQSERAPSDYAVSFCYNREAYHNRILKDANGFKNTKGTTWKTLSDMVIAYQSPHEDMQTIITEYVAKQSEASGGGDGAAYMNVSLVQEAVRLKKLEAQGGSRTYNSADIASALSEIAESGPAGAAMAESDGNDIAFDPIYDDVRFGFGQEFMAQTIGLMNDGEQPDAEVSLDNDEYFSLGEVVGEEDC